MLFIGLMLSCLVGCDTRFTPEQRLQEYVVDLNRSNFISIDIPSIVLPMPYPSPRERQQALTQFDISLLDFLSLQRCDVGFLAGLRNSVLGRVMQNSQRFLYEVNIIRAIESCHIKSQTLMNELKLVARTKRTELSFAFSNALWGGEESAAFFSLSNGFLPLSFSVANISSLVSSLRYLFDTGSHLQDLPLIESSSFENNLKVVEDSEYGGRLLYTLPQITRYLNAVSEQIMTLNNRVCGAPVQFLRKQFEVHYIRELQPYMARVNATAYQVLPYIEELQKLMLPLPDSLSLFFEQLSLTDKTSVWLRYQKASRQHAMAWSRLFQLCSVDKTALTH